ncbi:MAG: hypothetical protein WBA89_18710 [Microcoleus sp.]|uniref:hypothetical protein n=1 Tax=Microcoleus sp. TaxID=44472 RepID=UPI003C711ACA
MVIGNCNTQQSAVSSQQSTVNSQQSTVNSQQSAANSQPTTDIGMISGFSERHQAAECSKIER